MGAWAGESLSLEFISTLNITLTFGRCPGRASEAGSQSARMRRLCQPRSTLSRQQPLKHTAVINSTQYLLN